MTPQERVTEAEVERLMLLPHPVGSLKSEGPGPIQWNNWVAPQWVNALESIATLPGDAAMGREIPVDRIQEAGLTMLGGGRVIGKVPKGALTQFGGMWAKDVPRDRLVAAQQAEGRGMAGEEIWKQTGWFRDLDGQWKFEIPDQGASVHPTVPTSHEDVSIPFFDKRTLETTIQQPLTYAQYPSLRDMPVGNTGFNFGIDGAYGGGKIYLRSAKPDKFISTGLHETAHAVQEIEGWPLGSNVKLPRRHELKDKVVDIRLQRLSDQLGPENQTTRLMAQRTLDYPSAETWPSWMARRDTYASEYEKLKSLPGGDEYLRQYKRKLALKAIADAAFKNYERQHGEAMARLVERRAKQTPEHNAATYPISEYDVPLDQIIVPPLTGGVVRRAGPGQQ